MLIFEYGSGLLSFFMFAILAKRFSFDGPKIHPPKIHPPKIHPPKTEDNSFIAFPKKIVGTPSDEAVLLYAEPSTDSKILAAISKDHNINLVGVAGEFYKVEYPGLEGYMQSKKVCVDEVNDELGILPTKLDPHFKIVRKPVIYLYPERPGLVNVKLTYPGDLTTTYPKISPVTDQKNTYQWTVFAKPNGNLAFHGKKYHYLFWEAKKAFNEELSTGFVVEGKNAQKFLEEKLTILGLNRRERNDFIVYWLPELEKNAYNLVSFQGKTYTDAAKLDIKPEPKHLIRICMAIKKLDGPIRVVEQKLEKVDRKALRGFVAVEWGGFQV